jgi:hypothetical protein
VKKTLCAIAIVGLFTMSAMAENTRTKGVPSLVKSTGPARGHYVAHPSEVPPVVCGPVCLLYTGDTNTSSPDDNGFANENTLFVPETQSFAAFTVPAGQTWTVDGAFINMIPDGYTGLDPVESTWSISSGVSEGNAGAVVASGTSTATGTQFIPTGRFPFGFPEYSLRVKTTATTGSTVLPAGTYWLNITPQCTDSGNSSCSIDQDYWNNTFGVNNYGPIQPADQSYFNSGYFGFTFANLCEVSSTGCQVLSFGIIGTSAW